MAVREKYRIWIEARKRHHLSHAQVQMARELGFNPKKLGRIDNHKQEIWKDPLPVYIQDLYFKRFKRDLPLKVLSMEELAKEQAKKKNEKRKATGLQEITSKESKNV
jgi:hypothetical protein